MSVVHKFNQTNVGANNNGNHDVSPKSKRQVGVVAGVDVDVLKRDLVEGIGAFLVNPCPLCTSSIKLM